MNIFDDLVNELKEEDLLEETVMEDAVILTDPEDFETITEDTEETEEELESFLDEVNISVDHHPIDSAESNFLEIEDKKLSEEEKSSEYFRKRAMSEVSFLQMVELVLSGVEREQMKIIPKSYDDLKVKKLLHEYLQVSKENNQTKQAEFEFQLLQETEAWYTALTKRDKRISVAHLRRFCETTRPALSSTALVSISRFYRNSPFYESIRNKFDLIITRVFSKDLGNDKRELVFTREELINHITGLYTEWESVPMYSTDADDPELLELVAIFEEFIKEAEKAERFDELVQNGFFNRLRTFKESANENFYAPTVTAVAIECNIKIGNCYVDLIEKEREKANAQLLQEKYGMIIDQVVSDVTSKTLELVDLLDEKRANSKEKNKKSKPKPVKTQNKSEESTILESIKNIREKGELFKVNKWVLISSGFLIVAMVGHYIWTQYGVSTPEQTTTVQKVNLEGLEISKYLKAPRVSGEVFYAVVLENWESLPDNEKENVLKQVLSLGEKEKFQKVHLFNKDGRTVGTSDGEKVFVKKVS